MQESQASIGTVLQYPSEEKTNREDHFAMGLAAQG